VAEVTIHPEAEAEYEHALGWYLDRIPRAAERFETTFDEAIEAIRSHPTLFPFCDEIHPNGVYSCCQAPRPRGPGSARL
jgi:plasmid stabilization system protein ParE